MRTLKINLLYNCTAKCSHCRFNCENESPIPTPDFEGSYNIAKALRDAFGLDTVVVLGGEPTIFKEETILLLQRLNSLGVMTRIETNASWARSLEDAMAFLKPLKEMRTNVMFSLDGFHSPYVPIQNVIHAVNACAALEMDFCIESEYLDLSGKKHKIDQVTEDLNRLVSLNTHAHIRKFDGGDFSGNLLFEGGVIFIGRAADRFGDEFSAGRGIPTGPCTAVPWWIGGDIASTDLLILEPGGYLTKGCGIAIGNVYTQDVVEMVEKYDAYSHPVFSVLLKDGPVGLAKMAEAHGYRMKDDYADKCHLCHEARQALKPFFDDVLKPDQHYIK